MVAAEAAASGTPVVVTDQCGVAEPLSDAAVVIPLRRDGPARGARARARRARAARPTLGRGPGGRRCEFVAADGPAPGSALSHGAGKTAVIDLAVLARDPRFGGGARAHFNAFWQAAMALGRSPELFYLAHPSLVGRAASPLSMRRLSVHRFASSIRRIGSGGKAGAPPSHRTFPLGSWRPSRRMVSPPSAAGVRIPAGSRRPSLPRSEGGSSGSHHHGGCRDRQPADTATDRAGGAAQRAARLRDLGIEHVRARGGCGTAAGEVEALPIPVDSKTLVPVTPEAYLRGLKRPTLVFIGRAADPSKNCRSCSTRSHVSGARCQTSASGLSASGPRLRSRPASRRSEPWRPSGTSFAKRL